MVGFLLILFVLAICGLLFGKADTKKELLNQVGLDLSQDRYETKKENEFRKYSLQAMKTVIELDTYRAKTEMEYLDFLSDKLEMAAYGKYETNSWGGEDYNTLYLGVKKHYIEHASSVIYRRRNDIIKKGAATANIDFSDKNRAKKYCESLWEKYQYPWPNNWMQTDGL